MFLIKTPKCSWQMLAGLQNAAFAVFSVLHFSSAPACNLFSALPLFGWGRRILIYMIGIERPEGAKDFDSCQSRF
jgi:hypothetical protein